MASYRLYPTPTHQDSPESIEWEPVEWADEDAFADAHYPETDVDAGERRFYTVAIRRGQLPDSTTGSVAILGVTRDLEVGYETRLPADVDDGTWTLADHDDEGIPPAVTERPPRESTIPEGRRSWYREVLERAHGLGLDDPDETATDEEFRTATQLRADGGTPTCGKRRCDDAGTVSYSERGAVRVRCERHALEAVDGIGPTTADRLFDEFGSLEEICYASRYRRTAIAQLRGFSPDSASELEEKLKGAGIWQDPDDDLTTDDDTPSERELVERAVREAIDLVEAGDGADVAVDYIVEEHGLEHRRADILRRVLEHLEDDQGDEDDDDDARPVALPDGGQDRNGEPDTGDTDLGPDLCIAMCGDYQCERFKGHDGSHFALGGEIEWFGESVDRNQAAGTDRDEPNVRTDGGQDEHTATIGVADVEELNWQTLAKQWAKRAGENVDKWGEQDLETLLLAAQEELGELTQAVLEARAENGDPERIVEEIVDLAALLFQIRWTVAWQNLQTDTDHDDPDTRADGGRDPDSRGREAFLDGDAHWCDICSRPFDTFPELANHDCRPRTDDGVPIHVHNGGGSTSVLGPDPDAFEAKGGDRQ